MYKPFKNSQSFAVNDVSFEVQRLVEKAGVRGEVTAPALIPAITFLHHFADGDMTQTVLEQLHTLFFIDI